MIDPPPEVLDHLHRLALAVGDDVDPQLRDDVAELTAVLVGVVSGYAGVQITIFRTGHPVVLTILDADQPHTRRSRGRGQDGVPSTDRHPADRRAVTSVGVRLRSMSSGFDRGSRAVIYSRTLGSLVDLAADLSYALTTQAGDTYGTTGSHPAVELDADLPFTATETSITGLDELATIHRAIGLLIDQGHHPESAADALHGQAATAGLTTHALAIRLLAPSP
ncbi:MAG TPA: hypothetical protein VIT41_09065 [Microlunatus sp.]